jgi:thermitase
MRRFSLLACAVILALSPSFVGPSPTSAQPEKPKKEKPTPQKPLKKKSGEILVKVEENTPKEKEDQIHQKHKGQVIETIADIDVKVVKVRDGDEEAAVRAYEAELEVEFAEVQGIWEAVSHGTGFPQDPMFDQQWQYTNIRALQAWGTNGTQGSGTIAIAILDSGVDQDHADLSAKIKKKSNHTTSSTSDDRYGHGTHVAGSAAAATNNTRGVAGTCPNCVIHNVKVLGDDGNGAWSWIANGINSATNSGAKVISMSLGGYYISQTVELAVNRAWSRGVVLLGAAGNGDENGNGQDWGFYPGAFTNVIAVAASDRNDAKAQFSNYGTWVEVTAPGVDIWSTTMNGDYAGSGWSGTSMATPHVAGLAGLIWSKPGLCSNNTCVRNKILATADKVADTKSHNGATLYAGSVNGRINACKAVGATC